MSAQDLYDHAAGGLTTLCHCWSVTRRDGTVFGFTDHDCKLSFEGVSFAADSGLSAKALVQSTGLSVDNTEALGALCDAALTEEDIRAGRFDGAEVRSWLVNWANVEERVEQFRGTIGEVRRAGGAFQAELRGLTEALNQPQGRVYQTPCAAVLGDGRCGFDIGASGFARDVVVEVVAGRRLFTFAGMDAPEAGWFERGVLRVLSGAGEGLTGLIKIDRSVDGARELHLWEALPVDLLPGDALRLEPGCDKRAVTCKGKFDNFLNFQGFPHIPGEDWLSSYPKASGSNNGESRMPELLFDTRTSVLDEVTP